ncbi:MAG: cadmium-translocating P-type ATPase [Clostridia bacterium]|nr:cadmium-translocating P-type ATPase [Clostridia bacterium]
MKTVLQLDGLDCAACAAELEEQIAKIDGILSANVAFATQKLSVEYQTQDALDKAIYAANHFEEVHVVFGVTSDNKRTEQPQVQKSHRGEWLRILLSAFCLSTGLICTALSWEIIAYVAYAVAYLSVAFPILIATGKNIAKGRIFDENFLMTVASIGAIILGETLEGVAVMLLYQIGETLQSIAVGASRRSITQLMELKSETAILLSKGEQQTVSAKDVQKGDILLVKTGDKIPVDGMLLSVEAVLDTKSLTGESEPRTAKLGDEMLSGCVNVGGVFKMQAKRAYEDSAAQRILQLVENAASSKAKPEKFITKFARYYTPIVCGLALLLALIAPLIHGWIAVGYPCFYAVERWVRSALTFLVVSCPCALIVSVPLSYFSGIGACAKRGVLVKGATYLDTLAQAKTVAFDKTGTLTQGNFAIVGVHALGVSEIDLLALAAAVEKQSSHPIAKAFLHVRTASKATDVQETAGRGLAATVDRQTVLVGNAKLLQENGVAITELNSVHTIVYVARAGEHIGSIEVGDTLRPESITAIEKLKKLGLSRIVMLTGDREDRARQMANQAGITTVFAGLLPDGKLETAQALQKDGLLIYVGDGINDAPVMAVADCAVSMGKLGSAAAVETSDLVLIADDLNALPKGVTVARKTRKIVLQNIVFSIVMKTAFMALGALGMLPLSLAVFADVGVMLLAVCNSFRIRGKY